MRLTIFSLTILAVGALALPAQANDFWHRAHLDYLRMNCWPEPFVHADRNLVRNPLVAMTNSGWKLQNTLSHHFFDLESQELTRAGQMKLHWIVTQAPAHRRTVFVVRTLKSEATDARMASVQNHMHKLLPNSGQPEVLVSDIVPHGGAGDYFDNVDRQLKASVPIPRLPPRGGVSEGFGG